jgi:serine/threonine-protein kinase HipA
MVLNVLIENTDDHAKNHALLYANGHWRLSPVFDIQPQRQGIGYQQLRIGIEGHVATLVNVRSEAGRFMQKPEETEAIIDGVVKQVRDWQDVFAQAGVSQRDIEFCGRYVLGAQLLG